ncbi:MAG: hypothetical protein HFJ05_01175 [Eubacterium sp.]|nr:hypothetical protein [Eubacterium sp.]
MFYIRKLSKRSNLFKIKSTETSAAIAADVLKQELGTSGNTLLFWKCDSLDTTKDAIKAILLSTTSIETSQFIIVDDELLEKYQIETDDTNEGITGYKGFENLHVDFCNLTYEKIGFILNMIKEIAEEEKRTPELKKDEVKRYIIEVKEAGLLNQENLRPELRSAINKYCKNTV